LRQRHLGLHDAGQQVAASAGAEGLSRRSWKLEVAVSTWDPGSGNSRLSAKTTLPGDRREQGLPEERKERSNEYAAEVVVVPDVVERGGERDRRGCA